MGGKLKQSRTLTAKQLERFATRRYFTTGDIADLCETAPRTVCRWIDEEIIPGSRLAGTQTRRVSREVLLAFLRAHNYRDGLAMLGDGPEPLAARPAPRSPSKLAVLPGKRYYTTTDIATLCQCSNHTVCVWIDSGKLPGVRVGTNRRVGRDVLLTFLEEQGYHEAMALLTGHGRRVLALGLNGMASQLAAALPEGVALDTANTLWEAAVLYTRARPETVVLGEGVGYTACRELIAAVRQAEPTPRVVAVRPESERPGWLGMDVVEVASAAGVLAALGKA